MLNQYIQDRPSYYHSSMDYVMEEKNVNLKDYYESLGKIKAEKIQEYEESEKLNEDYRIEIQKVIRNIELDINSKICNFLQESANSQRGEFSITDLMKDQEKQIRVFLKEMKERKKNWENEPGAEIAREKLTKYNLKIREINLRYNDIVEKFTNEFFKRIIPNGLTSLN